jgi:hypothetical protein
MDAVKVCAVPSARVPIVGGRVLIGRCNPVINGDFRDLTGLVLRPEAGWYSGMPAGWVGRSGQIFAVKAVGQTFFANLHVLTSETGVFFRQDVGRSCCGRVSLRFYVDNPYNNALYGDYSLTYQIIADGAVAASEVVSGGRNAPRTVTLQAQVKAGAPIAIAFCKGALNHAMGITDVSMVGVVRD